MKILKILKISLITASRKRWYYRNQRESHLISPPRMNVDTRNALWMVNFVIIATCLVQKLICSKSERRTITNQFHQVQVPKTPNFTKTNKSTKTTFVPKIQSKNQLQNTQTLTKHIFNLPGTCRNVTFGSKLYYDWRRFAIFSQIFAETPKHYGICVPFKAGSSQMWHGIGELYNGNAQKKAFLKKNFSKYRAHGELHKLNRAFMQYRQEHYAPLSVQVPRTVGKRVLIMRHPVERLISFWDNKFKRLENGDKTKREDVLGLYGDFMIEVFGISEKRCLPEGISPIKVNFLKNGPKQYWGDSANKNYAISFRELVWLIIVVDNLLKNDIKNCGIEMKDFDEHTKKRLHWQYFYMHIGPIAEHCHACELVYNWVVDLRELTAGFQEVENDEFAFLWDEQKKRDDFNNSVSNKPDVNEPDFRGEEVAILNRGGGASIGGKGRVEAEKLVLRKFEELESMEKELLMKFYGVVLLKYRVLGGQTPTKSPDGA